MKSKCWKIAAVVLSMLIIITFGLSEGFDSYYNGFVAHPVGENGTIIVLAALKSVNVNGNIQVSYTGTYHGSAIITLENGTQLTVNNTTDLTFHFSRNYFAGQTTSAGGMLNMSLSPGSPIDMAIMHNASLSYYLNGLPGVLSSYGSYANLYTLYVHNYAQIVVTMDSGPV